MRRGVARATHRERARGREGERKRKEESGREEGRKGGKWREVNDKNDGNKNE